MHRSLIRRKRDGPRLGRIGSRRHRRQQGYGLAIAETLASEGARVAVMARGKAGLDAAEEKLRAAGAPDALGISVDMTDAASIVDGFDVVANRWGALNSLVHTIGPGDGSRRWEMQNGTLLSRSALCRACAQFEPRYPCSARLTGLAS